MKMKLWGVALGVVCAVVVFQNCSNHNFYELNEPSDSNEIDTAKLGPEDDSVEIELQQKASASGVRPCLVLKTAYVTKLDKVYKLGSVRVFYTVTANNPDAVLDQTDRNKNKVPDYVEDLARQITATRMALNSLGFVDPLNSPRYRAYGVKYIDVHVRNMAENGLAYDEANVYPNNALKENACTVQIDVSNKLAVFPGTWSVGAHELFHIYQYGMTMFKRSWFLEGTAAWGERVIRLGGLRGSGLTPLPSTPLALQQKVFAVPYNELWDRLATLSDRTQGEFALSSNLMSETYVDGSRIFKDQKLVGIAFMKTVLKHLAQESDDISAQNNWDKYSWKEADQTDPRHEGRMIDAVQRAMMELGMDRAASSEISSFLRL
ncbi:MAG: hypothetical protein KF799_08930 [Bdellovibrionales bacterium]|nr:hypothetical protein [Bdellovibrionales bacterium]